MVRTQRGFNLIEVMVTLTVLGVLISLTAPTFVEWLQSQRIRAGAEAIVNGLQVARGEAIKQNLPVVFGLEPPTTGWTVCPALPIAPCDSTTPTGSFIQNRSGEEGSGNAQVQQIPDGQTLVTFSPLGAVLATNLDGQPPLTQVDVFYNDRNLCSEKGGTTRCLRVVISAGGSVRMCDPTPGIVAPDTRACP